MVEIGERGEERREGGGLEERGMKKKEGGGNYVLLLRITYLCSIINSCWCSVWCHFCVVSTVLSPRNMHVHALCLLP